MATTLQNTTRAGMEFYTPAELAARWKWHAGSIRRLLRRGDLPSLKISGKRLIPLADVMAFEIEHLSGTSRQVREQMEVPNV